MSQPATAASSPGGKYFAIECSMEELASMAVALVDAARAAPGLVQQSAVDTWLAKNVQSSSGPLVAKTQDPLLHTPLYVPSDTQPIVLGSPDGAIKFDYNKFFSNVAVGVTAGLIVGLILSLVRKNN